MTRNGALSVFFSSSFAFGLPVFWKARSSVTSLLNAASSSLPRPVVSYF